MDEIKDFYSKQNKWSGCYTCEISQYNRDRAANIERLIGPGRKSILELGAGGGQNAVACADLGYDVTAVEFVPELAENITQSARVPRKGALRVICDDFYKVEINDTFDIVTYWDGFGIGTDNKQKQLLKRISGWLKPQGCVLIDVYSPGYFSKIAGRETQGKGFRRRYEYDALTGRMIDAWWPQDDKSKAVKQSLRCYSVAEIKDLLKESALSLSMVDIGSTLCRKIDESVLNDVPLYTVMLKKQQI
ncbi:class I SAM-dependent methyltransferase [Elusimicrobiota bacterium]